MTFYDQEQILFFVVVSNQSIDISDICFNNYQWSGSLYKITIKNFVTFKLPFLHIIM